MSLVYYNIEEDLIFEDAELDALIMPWFLAWYLGVLDWDKIIILGEL